MHPTPILRVRVKRYGRFRAAPAVNASPILRVRVKRYAPKRGLPSVIVGTPFLRVRSSQFIEHCPNGSYLLSLCVMFRHGLPYSIYRNRINNISARVLQHVFFDLGLKYDCSHYARTCVLQQAIDGNSLTDQQDSHYARIRGQ